MEVWKDIKEFEGYYQVSNYGNVKRIKNIVLYSNGNVCTHKTKILSPEISKGYKRVTLSKNNNQKRFLVHRLVAIHFIFNPDNLKCVNHKNGIKTDNKLQNLEWCDYFYNELHSYNVLNKINPIRKLKETDINDIRKNCKKGVRPFNKNKGNVKLYAEKYNVDKSTILNVLNNKYYV